MQRALFEFQSLSMVTRLSIKLTVVTMTASDKHLSYMHALVRSSVSAFVPFGPAMASACLSLLPLLLLLLLLLLQTAGCCFS